MGKYENNLKKEELSEDVLENVSGGDGEANLILHCQFTCPYCFAIHHFTYNLYDYYYRPNAKTVNCTNDDSCFGVNYSMIVPNNEFNTGGVIKVASNIEVQFQVVSSEGLS